MSLAAPIADDYDTFCDGVRALCGVDLSQYRRQQMERRLRTFFARRGRQTLAEGLGAVRDDPAELEELLDRMTINVSALWRHPRQIEHLTETVLPDLATSGRIQVWSAGCSYGAEAYTLAAVCHACIPETPASILGTDIDRRMIARAQEGRFSDHDAREAPAAALRQSFEPVDGGWQASRSLRSMVRFEVADLLRVPPRPRRYDLIVCRNTVIYFSEPVRDALHHRLAQSLRPGGYLLIGATERVSDPAALGLEATVPFFYRRAR